MPHLRITDLPASGELPPSLLVDIGQRRTDLALIRGVVDPAALAAVVQRIEARRADLPWVLQESDDRERPQMGLLGSSLTPYNAFPDGPPLPYYLDQADRFRALYAELFEGVDLLGAASAVLSRLGGGRPVVEPVSPDGRAFAPATLRRVPPGKGIPTHVGRWFQETGGFRPLLPQVETSWQLSWFVPLQQGEQGGELVVYDLQYGDPAVPWRERGRVLDDEAIERGWQQEPVLPQPGDLMVFNGGHLYHRVSPVQGSRPRYTFGGFVGLSADHRRLVRWN
ncbi:2OG-Fe(II) oxygenase [Myxococcota bacterium]|nr:2OG-Fe(II) oxygenase [Myxococcota bacterium]